MSLIRKRVLPGAALIVLLLSAGMAAAPGVEDEVRDLRQAGEILPFDEIQKSVRSQVRGDYVGADFDAGTRTYRFRFLVNGNVINVDVDARTGERVRRSARY